MSSKLLVVIATGDREKALTGMMYAANAAKRDWMDDVKVVFFGPSEQLLVDDDEVRERAADLVGEAETFACKFISDRDETSATIDGLGIQVEYVGSIISDYIKDGYAPMVW